MKAASILNHVLGPIMRGPSSSHTAGAFHIASMALDLLGGTPASARIRFDQNGSYGRTYAQQGADRAFLMGLLGRSLVDERFSTCLQESGMQIRFEVGELQEADHPNAVDLELASHEGKTLAMHAASIGGGEVEIRRVDGWAVRLDGTAHEVLVEMGASEAAEVTALLDADASVLEYAPMAHSGERALVIAHRRRPLPPTIRQRLERLPGCRWRACGPVYFLQTGHPMFTSAGEMVALAETSRMSLGRIALAYESQRLERSEAEILDEMIRRYRIMKEAVQRGLDPGLPGMQLLEPSAGAVMNAGQTGRLAVGGIHLAAAARAMAVMHVNSAMGVVCAAPTGGSAGTLPGVVVSLAEQRALTEEQVARLLLAAGLIGVFVSNRATFAAEVAGCQVEIGAAGAMAAAAVVEAAGGTARQAADAAAIAFQNTMGSVCDLVQGMVEIPCHTRNALAASSAFVCADLVLGGYANPIPLDETIDAVHAVGKLLPPELRCTAKGGLALAPSALRLCPRPCR